MGEAGRRTSIYRAEGSIRQFLNAKLKAIRGAYDFWRWQRARWRDFKNDAAVRYSTEQVERQLIEAKDEFNKEETTRFCEPLAALGRTREAQDATLNELERKLALFKRDYSSELSEAFDELEAIRIALSEAHGNLKDANSDVKGERAYLRHWHSRGHISSARDGRAV